MIDRFFAPALAFIMLIAGTVMIASGLFAEPRAEVQVAQGMPTAPIVLETVVITGKRERAVHNDKSASGPVLPAAEGRSVLMHGARD